MTVRNPSTRDVMLEFISENLDELESAQGEKRFVNMMINVFKYATPNQEVGESLKEEIGKMSISDFSKDQIISKLNSVEFWVFEHEERVCEWVSERMSSIGVGSMKLRNDKTDLSMSNIRNISEGVSVSEVGDSGEENYEEEYPYEESDTTRGL